MKFALLAGALALGTVSLAGCAQTNGVITPNLTPAASAKVQAYLDQYCPVLPGVTLTVQANPAVSTTSVRTALALLASVCPPNPPPTNGLVIASDILGAYSTLKPLIK